MASLDSVKLKIVRAEEHFDAVSKIASAFAYGECEIVRQHDTDTKLDWLVWRAPVVPVSTSLIIGDCLHNIRCALDYLVWQLVLANPIPSVPVRQNMFPICTSRDLFKKQIERDRLLGVPAKAQTLIEGFQPYPGWDNPLRLL